VAADGRQPEQKLKPYESTLNNIQLCLFWVSQIGRAVVLALVNLLFLIGYKLDLPFPPSVLLCSL
jgi:hypothetical protein